MSTERRTVFGEVLAELMEGRGITPSVGNMAALAEDSRLDPDTFLARVAGERGPDLGYLTGLDDELDLSVPEKTELAIAFAFEKRS